MTEKMLKDSIVSGKEVYGMCVVNDEPVLDKCYGACSKNAGAFAC